MSESSDDARTRADESTAADDGVAPDDAVATDEASADAEPATTDAERARTDADDAAQSADSATADSAADGDTDTDEDVDLDALRAEVEEKYDFENFGPSDMAEMSPREWEVAFDPDTWITGDDLLDRVEKDLRNRIARRDVFAVLERAESPDRVVAYSDEGWAVVYDDGSVEGEGTVLRDVKPTVALCSMDSYEVEEPPEAYELPSPEEIESGTGEFGNNLLQVIALAQVVAGLGILGIWLFTGLIPSPPGQPNILIPMLAAFFLGVGLLLLFVVANARLSDRFRAEEYRDRLRAAGIGGDGDGDPLSAEDRPEFLPFEEVVDTTLDDGAPAADPSVDAVDRDGTDAERVDTADSDGDAVDTADSDGDAVDSDGDAVESDPSES
ncbi:hypothetical protein RYH80_12490 [Halobaculum sp. MBLA0147]|uniref:DUF7319 domain-containing protein n=1 Tax=Halobaculum sp. MBLA0147 TaxID=3079934 RepID=UPI003525FFB5